MIITISHKIWSQQVETFCLWDIQHETEEPTTENPTSEIKIGQILVT